MDIVIATAVVLLFTSHLVRLPAFAKVSITSPLTLIPRNGQTYLYTDLVITIYRAIHSMFSSSQKLIHFVGRVCLNSVTFQLFYFGTYHQYRLPQLDEMMLQCSWSKRELYPLKNRQI